MASGKRYFDRLPSWIERLDEAQRRRMYPEYPPDLGRFDGLPMTPPLHALYGLKSIDPKDMMREMHQHFYRDNWRSRFHYHFDVPMRFIRAGYCVLTGRQPMDEVGRMLKSYVERYERIQKKIDELKADQQDCMNEARGTGFDLRTIKDIIRLRKLHPDERAEREALLDIYKAALGMLEGTPLGRSALKRLSPEPKEESDQRDIEDYLQKPDDEAAPVDDVPKVSADEAREQGRQAHLNGEPVTANPHPAMSIARAAWDEGWCSTSGSDGMDLPAAWSRRKKKDDQPPEGE